MIIHGLFGALFLLLQALPLPVNLCVDVDASGATMGYKVQLDAGPVVDVGMPAPITCSAFVGGATSPGVPFAVAVSASGLHTVTIVGYNLTGGSPATAITFPIGPSPGKPANGRVVK